VSALQPYSYAVVRVVPRVDREEFINAGAVVYSRGHRFLQARMALDETRLCALHPGVALADVRDHLDAFCRVCHGDAGAGPMALLTHSERFHWLTATRSTVVQCSPIHCGMTSDPETALVNLVRRMVVTG
jgi:hypothetical protein